MTARGGVRKALGRARELHGLRRAAELLDPPRHLGRVRPGFLEVVLQALAVVLARSRLSMRLQCGLELALLGVGLVEEMHELGVARGRVGHGWASWPMVSVPSAYP